ncbi:ASCH/PUA domain-containing protein [Emticicia sp. BO119]|uniref:ASCH/PUA domain-containing protein n=1 Tax=Emticicia sp. BO119 TaxID=2757768 RepID=UPI0015F0D891|nr:ASCH/PUA domain-containing protein [Emticicia sp. BO119]MBA4849475.1 DUF3850 domain-containing protein [Emticicia sp. BO119]
MALHKLKTWPEYFQAVWAKEKTFEVRLNDRNFKVGNKLWLQEFDNKKNEFTGRYIQTRITYILLGGSFGVIEGYCVLGISEEIVGFNFSKPL